MNYLLFAEGGTLTVFIMQCFDFLGFGVYNYPNKFFRYEGEWKEGKKHGVYHIT